MAAQSNETASGQFTVDMLSKARDFCFAQLENMALPTAARNDFSVKHNELDQLIDELMTKQFHEKPVDDGGVDDLIGINGELSKQVDALASLKIGADTVNQGFAAIDKMLKVASPLVAV